jgi:hypothetical protein
MIYIDSNVFIYPHSGNGLKSEASIKIIQEIIIGGLDAFTSYLTWDEVVHSLRKIIGKEKAIEQGKIFLNIPNVNFLSVNNEIIRKSQELMEKYSLKPRDAIHAASAILNKCDFIVSDDSDFDKVKEIKRKGL